MFDAFVGGVMTLIVIFLMFCGAVLVVEVFPIIGWIGIVIVALVGVSALIGFTGRR